MKELTAALVYCPFVSNLSIPPLAPALLKSCLTSAGIQCRTWDFNLEMHHCFDTTQISLLVSWMTAPDISLDPTIFGTYREFVVQCVDQVMLKNPDRIGISVFSHESQRFAEDFCWHLRRRAAKIPIILGGSGVAVVQNQYQKPWSQVMLDNGLATCAIHGEAEITIADTFRDPVPGIHQQQQIDNDELSDLPVPNFDDYDLDAYGDRDQLQLPITASKGCVRKCSFCDVAAIWPKFRYRRGENVAEEMISIYERYGIKRFAFTDSLINGGLKPFRKMNEILSERLPETVKYSGQFICRDSQSMPPRDFQLMKSGGCNLVSIGIESGSQKVRNHMAKGFSTADIHYTAQQLIDNNITQYWNIIVGYPTETDDDWQMTLDLIEQYKDQKDLIKITPVGVFQLLRNTPMTTSDMLEELDIETHIVNGYSEYNWVSALYPTNDLPRRAQRWFDLVELLKSHDMLSSSAQRIDQKSLTIQKQVEYYANKPTKITIPIQEQLFQEPNTFVN